MPTFLTDSPDSRHDKIRNPKSDIRNPLYSCVLCLSLIHAGTAAAETKAFVGARIFDGTGKRVIEKGTIVVIDGRIAAVGPSNKVKAPKGARTIGVSGKTI